MSPAAPLPAYAELHVLSNFSFQRGASSAEELVRRAAELDYTAIAVTDECTMAGVVRALEAAEANALRLIIGTELTLVCGLRVVLLAADQRGYTALCDLVTRGRRAASKGEYRLLRSDLHDGLPGVLALWLPGHTPDAEAGRWLKRRFGERTWITVELALDGTDQARLDTLTVLGQELGLPLVAAGDVQMHRRSRRPLHDVLTAIRRREPVAACGAALHANGERHLRTRRRLAALYPRHLLDETIRIADQCRFSLRDLRYEYPEELVPRGLTPTTHLRQLTEAGIERRWPAGEPTNVRRQVEHELTLIAELDYEAFFLTVYDIVAFARSQGILCQGRGSAANSAVCFCLGITEVDPGRMNMLFERFISKERNEPPDIDVDFEHDRREEVLQYVYRKYGRQRAALAATVICYRPKSAVRDVGKALGLDLEQIDRLTRAFTYWDSFEVLQERLVERGFDPESPVIRKLLALVEQLIGFPRHLSQHVGGFVISQQPLHELVPVENAAMADRTIIQWDKDDLETLGLLKVDCLALGMLSALRRALDLIHHFRGRRYGMATIPAEDPAVYAMIQKADTIGVFQIESRAQMSMLPRLRPACYYDLVIEVAIVRPGPIQGKMVHPYLRRRQGLEPVEYPSDDLREVFERTLGVPIFQEQVMQLAIVAAGFTPGEADQLRRSMAAWKRRGGLGHFERRIIEGMRERGYDESFARQVFEQIKGFGSYGFPESHAASFALLVYVSAWIKCHEPAIFCCALLNSLPMGFYSASQLIQDARAHDVEVRPPDVCHSDWDSTLERRPDGEPALRLGLRVAKGVREDAGRRIMAARADRPFNDVEDLVRRSDLDRHQRGALADADALATLVGNRHAARWAITGVERPPGLLKKTTVPESDVELAAPSAASEVLADYAALGLSLKQHPLSLLRKDLNRRQVRSTGHARGVVSGTRVRCAGLVTLRQRPGTASGVTFVTLEDEDGMLNVIIWRDLADAQRRDLLETTLMGVDGIMESQQGVQHLIAERLHNYNDLIGELQIRARNFC
ncbi:MAG: error-prone DNA polymerase [Pseudomonadota bacterium]